MSSHDDLAFTHIGTIEVDDRRFNVSCRVGFDGIEYVGRLYFADEAWDDVGFPDRGALPGNTKDQCLVLARAFDAKQLTERYRRALAEKRRYKALRRVTEEILAKIRYLNQLAISMRAGLLDVEGAAGEIDATEAQLHALISRLREAAGVEDE